MNFSALSIKNPIPAIMLFGLLTVAGLIAFKFISVQDFPNIDIPVVAINAKLEGAAPAQLETEVARKLEDGVATLEGVKHINTVIRDGEVTILVEFILEKDSAEAVNDVRSAVDRVRADLPADLREPSVTKVTNAGKAVLVLTASSTKLDEQDLSWFVDNTVTKRLLTVPGVSTVKRLGGVDREIRIELDPEKMAALKVSALDVSRQLKLVQREASGGRGDLGGAEQNIRTIGTVKTVAELAAIELPLQNLDRANRKIRLDQVATIQDTFAERRSIALTDGKPVVAMEILRTKGSSEVEVAIGTRAAVAELQVENPYVTLTQEIDNATAIEENYHGSMSMLYEGAALAVFVVWWFLRDWRATLIVAIALPLSVIPALFIMKLAGFSLNTVTLLALALMVGVLVDDAIVEIENIARHLRQGKTPRQAALEAADEIGLAVIATTFALVAVFMPTSFMSGIPGKFFIQFGWTAVLSLLASLMVARLLTPMMAAYLLKPNDHPDQQEGRIMQRYMQTMRWCLSHRLATTICAILFFIGSIALAGILPTGFIPSADRAQTQINLELAPGVTLNETVAVAEHARTVIQTLPNIKQVFSSIGGGSSGDVFAPGAAAETRRAMLTVTLTHISERKESIKDIENLIRAKLADLPGARFQVGPPDTGVKMQLALRSEDAILLEQSARRAESELRTLRGIGGVNSNASLVRPEIIVKPDFQRAAELGVTAYSIGETVRVATAGDYDVNLPKLNLSERQIPIRVKFPDIERADLNTLEELTVPGKNGPIQLSNVADFTVESGPAQINRLDRKRNVLFNIELGARSLGELYQEAIALPAFTNLPPGVKIAEVGDTQEMKSFFVSFTIAMAVGILCIYTVLVLLFKDFMQPVTILMALPLSIGGAFLALLITHNALSMPSMIGLIMLMGIVTKNSILLVEYAIVARREGMSRFEALVDACHKRSRPILMTSIAMLAGMLPMALGYGADPSFRSPMAIAVIGGLISSTILSLLVVPSIFTYVDDAKKKINFWNL